MPIYIAEAADVILAEREDANHIESLQHQISNVSKGLLGPALWARWYFCIGPVARLAYYSVTTLFNIQTLGEENNDLLAVTNSGSVKLVPLWRRIVLVIFLVLQPLLTQTVVASFLQFCLFKFFSQRTHTTTFQSLWSLLLTILRRLQFTWLYFFGKQYILVKWLTGIEYISIRVKSNIQASKLFRILGVLTLSRTVFRIVVVITNFITGVNEKPILCKRFNFGRFQCPICLLNKPPACTPCGHIFCWYCILKYCLNSLVINQEAVRCPHCRKEFIPNRIVPIFNL